MAPVSDAGYSLTPVAEPSLGQLVAMNDTATMAGGAPGCPCQGGTAQPLAPESMAESPGVCDACSGSRVFDGCHLGGECGGDECCDCCRSWSVRAGAVIFQRENDRQRPLVTTPIAAGAAVVPGTVMDASQFNYPMRGGPDIDVIRYGCYFDVEARYFAVDEFTAGFGPTPLTGTGTVLFATPITYGGTSIAAQDISQLRSVEVNLRKEVIPCRLTLLAGYRHFELNEQIFGQISTAAAITSAFTVQAYNRMDGFQLGGEAVLWRPGNGRFHMEGNAKVGVFGDATSNYAASTGIGTVGSTGTHTAFMAEWGITGVVQLTDHLAGRAGYQGFLLDGVALAGEQIGVLDPLAKTASTENSGTPIYHGLVVDLEYSW
jgi:hypothetical protein